MITGLLEGAAKKTFSFVIAYNHGKQTWRRYTYVNIVILLRSTLQFVLKLIKKRNHDF